MMPLSSEIFIKIDRTCLWSPMFLEALLGEVQIAFHTCEPVTLYRPTFTLTSLKASE